MDQKLHWGTIIGFDYGLKNIGVAVGQSITLTASALPILKAKHGIPQWKDVDKLINEWNPDFFILGMPYNMDGSISDMAIRVKKFGNRLNARYRKSWYSVDERLTSREAKEWILKCGNKNRQFSKSPIDSLTAQIILESWMNN